MENFILIATMICEAALMYAVISWLASRLSPDEQKQTQENEKSPKDKTKDTKVSRWCLMHGTIVPKSDWFIARK